MGYIVYMSISGLTASWYFLKGTEYFPKYPLLGSLKRSFTTSFGSIAFAGLLLTVLNYLNSLLKYFGRACCFIPCIYCCCEYLRSCLKKMVSAITKLSLTYCAIYGVPFMEGCRRWTELSCRKFSDVLVHDGCITATITLNEIFYVMIAGLLGSFIAPRGFEIISFIWAANFTYSLFVILIKPTEAVFDTIIVCFIEEPSKLSQISNRLYERFCDQYHKRIEKFKKRNEKST